MDSGIIPGKTVRTYRAHIAGLPLSTADQGLLRAIAGWQVCRKATQNEVRQKRKQMHVTEL